MHCSHSKLGKEERLRIKKRSNGRIVDDRATRHAVPQHACAQSTRDENPDDTHRKLGISQRAGNRAFRLDTCLVPRRSRSTLPSNYTDPLYIEASNKGGEFYGNHGVA